MVVQYKIILGYAAAILTFLSYVPYFKNIFQGKTKPHIFSWLVWTLITATAFAAQIVKGAGAGAWATGVTAIICLAILIFSFFKGEKNLILFDWIGLVMSLLALISWWITRQPLLAVFLVTIADAIGSLLTFRKGFYKPFEETASTFALNSFKWVIAVFALQSFTVSTWLYPVSLIVTNGAIALMLIVRRKQLTK